MGSRDRSVDDALVDFTVEAVDEATAMLRHGDAATKLSLIKMVLGGALKSKESDSEGAIEDLKEEARALLRATLDTEGMD